jgi:outer membrane immunogenic protein
VTVAVAAIAHGGVGPASAAPATNEELTARIEALEKETAALRRENQTLRSAQTRANKPESVRPAASVEKRAVTPSDGMGSYAAIAPGTRTAAPAMAPVGMAGWTGFYFGPNIGLSIGRGPTMRNSVFGPAPSGDIIADTFTMSPFGVVGGGQIGYNWQATRNLVLGLEADLQGSGQSDTVCVFQCSVPATIGFNRNTTIEQKLDWFGTVRGRLGWTNGPALIYATGGLAYGHVTTDVTLNDFNFGLVVNPPTQHFERTKTGWTAGFGAETQLFGNWTGKIEYLYVDLGTTATGGFVSVFTPQVTQTHQYVSAFQDHIVRLGLNYHFDPVYASGGVGAVMFTKAPPLPVYGWNGAYVGANFGIGIARNDTDMPFSTINNTTGTRTAVLDDEQFKLNPLGAVGGGQVGYNWQVARNFLLGVETDIQGTTQRQSVCMNCGPIVGQGTIGTTLDQRIEWFGTLRGRVGLVSGPVLYYATAGLAYGHVTTDERVDTIPFLTGVSTQAKFGQTKVGWTAGGGTEAHLFGNWSVKAEYLYVDLSNVSGNVVAPELVLPLNINPGNINLSELRGFNSAIHDHVFRLGLNYRLDAGTVVAKY